MQIDLVDRYAQSISVTRGYLGETNLNFRNQFPWIACNSINPVFSCTWVDPENVKEQKSNERNNSIVVEWKGVTSACEATWAGFPLQWPTFSSLIFPIWTRKWTALRASFQLVHQESSLNPHPESLCGNFFCLHTISRASPVHLESPPAGLKCLSRRRNRVSGERVTVICKWLSAY